MYFSIGPAFSGDAFWEYDAVSSVMKFKTIYFLIVVRAHGYAAFAEGLESIYHSF